MGVGGGGGGVGGWGVELGGAGSGIVDPHAHFAPATPQHVQVRKPHPNAENLKSLESHSRTRSVADLGGEGGGRLYPSGIRPPVDLKGPPLYYFEISIFGDGP